MNKRNINLDESPNRKDLVFGTKNVLVVWMQIPIVAALVWFAVEVLL